MLLQSFKGEESGVSGIAVVSSTSSVQLPIDDFRISWSKSFHPASERRLLVIMAIEEQSLWQISFDFSENKRCITLVLDNLAGSPFDFELINPILDMLCSFFKFAIGIPLWIEGSGEVIDFDELSEGRKDTLVEVSLDIFL